MFMMHHRHRSEITMRDVVLDPTEILALYASPKSLQRGETIMLRDIKCQNQVCTNFFHALLEISALGFFSLFLYTILITTNNARNF